MKRNYLVAIDPWALLLPTSVYLKLVEKVHPHEPKVADIQRAVRAMSARERATTLANAKAIMAHCKTVEEVIGARK